MHARGAFEVKLAPLPTRTGAPGSSIARRSIEEQLRGDPDGMSFGEMLSASASTNPRAGGVSGHPGDRDRGREARLRLGVHAPGAALMGAPGATLTGTTGTTPGEIASHPWAAHRTHGRRSILAGAPAVPQRPDVSRVDRHGRLLAPRSFCRLGEPCRASWRGGSAHKRPGGRSRRCGPTWRTVSERYGGDEVPCSSWRPVGVGVRCGAAITRVAGPASRSRIAGTGRPRSRYRSRGRPATNQEVRSHEHVAAL
jgi:hypothetical protein